MRRVRGVSGMLLWRSFPLRWEEKPFIPQPVFGLADISTSPLIKAYSIFVRDEGTSPIHGVVDSFPFQI